MVTSRTVAAVMRRMAVKQSAHLRRESPMQIPTFARDLGERAAKTFGYTTLAALPVAFATQPFQWSPWASAALVGLNATLYSVLGSLASFKLGDTGTASAVKLDTP